MAMGMKRKTACDLRVLVRFDDGTMGGYAVNDIRSAERLREELESAGELFSDPDAEEDLLPTEQCHPAWREVFAVMRSALTMLTPPAGETKDAV